MTLSTMPSLEKRSSKNYVKDRKAELGVEEGVPVPPSGKGRFGWRSEAGRLAEVMEVGDSKVFETFHEAEKLRDAFRNHKFKAKIRRFIDDKDGRMKWRIWKVEGKKL